MELKDLRIRGGLSQSDMAKRLGTTQGYVSLIESGYRIPPHSVIQEYEAVAEIGKPRISKVREQLLRKTARRIIAETPAHKLEALVKYLKETA
jgi:transcriptional regulator with XRE-family HTH domain